MGFSLQFALICTVLEVGLALALVLALHPLLLKRPWLTAFLMLPMMISPALMGVMYRLVLNEFVGLVPLYLEVVGIYVNFLGPENVYATVVAIEVCAVDPVRLPDPPDCAPGDPIRDRRSGQHRWRAVAGG